MISLAFTDMNIRVLISLILALATTQIHARDINEQLRIAAGVDSIAVVKELIKDGADVNSTGYEGATALIYAVARGDQDIVELLLKKGADVNARDNRGGTPLHFAVWKGYVGIIKLLVNKGADINARTSDGRTPLRVAEINRRTEVEKYLHNLGATR